MSRIGKLPINVTSSVNISVDGGIVTVKGPKGTLTRTLPRGISVQLEANELSVQRRDDTKAQRSLHGLTRALLNNAVVGVSEGFEKKLEIHGVGYSAEAKGKVVNFKLGYSHPIDFSLPAGVDVKVERNALTVSGFDRQQVGQVAADIRKLRPPDVYKQKGIRYAGEVLRKKAGKAGAK